MSTFSLSRRIVAACIVLGSGALALPARAGERPRVPQLSGELGRTVVEAGAATVVEYLDNELRSARGEISPDRYEAERNRIALSALPKTAGAAVADGCYIVLIARGVPEPIAVAMSIAGGMVVEVVVQEVVNWAVGYAVESGTATSPSVQSTYDWAVARISEVRMPDFHHWWIWGKF